MDYNLIRLLVLVLCLLLICAIGLLNVLGWLLPLDLAGASEEHPIVVVRKTDIICTDIRQIISDCKNIYILNGQYGVVQAYSHDGQYQYSISVYDHSNGRIEIASDGEFLYICDKIGNIYVFLQDRYIEFLNRRESKDVEAKLHFGASDPKYSLKAGSVWYNTEDAVQKCIIQRPTWLAIYQGDVLTSTMFLLVIFCGVILNLPKTSKRPD